jgi:antirestriction protein ArdC
MTALSLPLDGVEAPPGDKRDRLLAELTDGVAQLTGSERWQAFLDMQARFHQYSFLNTLAIALQRPEATRVAGFHTWRQLGRWVRKGEKGIAILAPVVRRLRVTDADGEEHLLVGAPSAFRVVHVFDVAQTDGRELPTVLDRLSDGDESNAYERLALVARGLGYTVEEDYLPGERNGDCNVAERLIRVEVTNAPAQQVKTLAHEIAHAMLHKGFTDRALAELEAESVAYIVCRSIGIDSAAYSFGYVAHWSGGGPEAISAIKSSGGRIQATAEDILDRLAAAAGEEAA